VATQDRRRTVVPNLPLRSSKWPLPPTQLLLERLQQSQANPAGPETTSATAASASDCSAINVLKAHLKPELLR
jgi:hypothetical protein